MQTSLRVGKANAAFIAAVLIGMQPCWAVGSMDEMTSGTTLGQADSKQSSSKAEDCIRFGNPKHTDSISKYEINKPGHYCLTENLHARTEFPAPEPPMAEATMIIIWTSDVVLDLQGHTLGRGRLFKNPGGVGIEIHNSTNILIKNGTLQDFDAGIWARRSGEKVLDTPNFDPKTNTYHFRANNITLENITFKNNKKNFNISAPGPEKAK